MNTAFFNKKSAYLTGSAYRNGRFRIKKLCYPTEKSLDTPLVVGKVVPVSIVGIFDYGGVDVGLNYIFNFIIFDFIK